MDLFLRVRGYTGDQAPTQSNACSSPLDVDEGLAWKAWCFDSGVWTASGPSQSAYVADQPTISSEVLAKTRIVSHFLSNGNFFMFTYGPPKSGKSYAMFGEALTAAGLEKDANAVAIQRRRQRKHNGRGGGGLFDSSDSDEFGDSRESEDTSGDTVPKLNSSQAKRLPPRTSIEYMSAPQNRGIIVEFFDFFFSHLNTRRSSKGGGNTNQLWGLKTPLLEISVLEYYGGEWFDLLSNQLCNVPETSLAIFQTVSSSANVMTMLMRAQRRRMETSHPSTVTSISHLVVQVRLCESDAEDQEASDRHCHYGYFVDLCGAEVLPLPPGTYSRDVHTSSDAEGHMHKTFATFRSALLAYQPTRVDGVGSEHRYKEFSKNTRWPLFLKRAMNGRNNTHVVGIFAVPPSHHVTDATADILRFSEVLHERQVTGATRGHANGVLPPLSSCSSFTDGALEPTTRAGCEDQPRHYRNYVPSNSSGSSSSHTTEEKTIFKAGGSGRRYSDISSEPNLYTPVKRLERSDLDNSGSPVISTDTPAKQRDSHGKKKHRRRKNNSRSPRGMTTEDRYQCYAAAATSQAHQTPFSPRAAASPSASSRSNAAKFQHSTAFKQDVTGSMRGASGAYGTSVNSASRLLSEAKPLYSSGTFHGRFSYLSPSAMVSNIAATYYYGDQDIGTRSNAQTSPTDALLAAEKRSRRSLEKIQCESWDLILLRQRNELKKITAMSRTQRYTHIPNSAEATTVRARYKNDASARRKDSQSYRKGGSTPTAVSSYCHSEARVLHKRREGAANGKLATDGRHHHQRQHGTTGSGPSSHNATYLSQESAYRGTLDPDDSLFSVSVERLPELVNRTEGVSSTITGTHSRKELKEHKRCVSREDLLPKDMDARHSESCRKTRGSRTDTNCSLNTPTGCTRGSSSVGTTHRTKESLYSTVRSQVCSPDIAPHESVYPVVVESHALISAQRAVLGEELMARSSLELKELRARRKFEARPNNSTPTTQRGFGKLWLPVPTR